MKLNKADRTLLEQVAAGRVVQTGSFKAPQSTLAAANGKDRDVTERMAQLHEQFLVTLGANAGTARAPRRPWVLTGPGRTLLA